MNKNRIQLPNPWQGVWPLWKTFVFFSAAFLSSMTIILFISPVGPFQSDYMIPNWEEGDTATRTIIAPTNISYEDSDQTQARIQASLRLAKPVFELDQRISARILERFDQIQGIIQSNMARGFSPENVADLVERDLPGLLPQPVIVELCKFWDQTNDWINLRLLLVRALENGILNPPDQVNLENGIEFISIRNNRPTRIDLYPNNLIFLDEIKKGLFQLPRQLMLDFPPDSVFFDFLSEIVEENSRYSQEQTDLSRKEIEFSTHKVNVTIEKGEVIVPQNYSVTEDMLKRLNGLREFIMKQNISGIFGVSLFFLVVFTLLYLVLTGVKKREYLSPGYFILYLSFWLIHLALASFFSQWNLYGNYISAAFIPTAFFVVLVTILSNEGVGSLFAFFITLPILVIDRTHPEVYLTALMSGLSAPFLVMRLEKRMDLIRAGIFLSLAQGGIYFLVGLISNQSLNDLGLWALGGGINGLVGGLFVLGIIPILEQILNSPTRFRLVELSDLNVPIFKRMLLLAPGTYNHSVNVANLAESAALALGINTLLVRVGAYYHDIGKIDQSEYFIENQKSVNKHDEIKPSLSATILKSHVKIGVEKGKEIGLPQRIVDIISQHHGSGLIEFFYNKALEEDGKAKREDYCYPGPNPTFKESAVVMLADTVEAASRTLTKPSVTKLEKFIWELILRRYQEGLLNESNLTFKDLDLIHKSFVQILAGQFHSRIKYPGQKEEENERNDTES